jgi:hypothetical protein
MANNHLAVEVELEVGVAGRDVKKILENRTDRLHCPALSVSYGQPPVCDCRLA